jgi:hypothetical protein
MLLDTENHTADLNYQLPRSFLGLGDGIVLPHDGLLLAHRDLDDERLILFKGEDNPIWQRSYSQTSGGRPRLLESGGHPYLILSNDDNFFDQVVVFSIDIERSKLTRLLETISDSAISSPIQAFPVSEELILIYAGNGLLALDPEEAKTAASQSSFVP